MRGMIDTEIYDYPKAYIENLRYRTEVLTKGNSDPNFAAAMKEACKRDRLFLFNTFYFTYDPRTEDKTLPFVTYPFQDEAILWDYQCLLNSKDNFMDKSRDMGATWMFVGNDLAEWLFSPEKIEIQWGSRKEQYVDSKGDLKAIFPRFRFLLRKIPKWLLPKGFNFNTHDNYMRLVNPETGSIIAGEATNSEFGRGDRKLRVRFDEFAFWDCDIAAWEGAADVTNCRSAFSTPNGSANKFAMLKQGEEISEKKSLHWTLHPLKRRNTYYFDGDGNKISVEPEKANQLWLKGIGVRSPWYDAERARRSEQSVAQELDISYLRSGLPFFAMQELEKQHIWELMHRRSPLDPIPWGKFVRGNLVDQRGTVKFIEKPNGWLRLFELPQNGSTFIVGADTSEGLPKGDQCAAVVRDKWTRNIFATMYENIKPEEFAPKLHLISRYFKKQNEDALLAVENNNHGYCFDGETEVLTNEGWKLFKDLNKKEKVATLSIQKDTIEYQKPLKYTKLYEKKMYVGEQGHTNFCVSSDHNMLTYTRHKEPRMELWPLSDYKKSHFILKHSSKWIGKERKTIKIGKYTINMDDWLAFLGILLADGNVRAEKKHNGRQYYFLSIAQSKSYLGNIKKIRQICDRMPFHYWEYIQKNGDYNPLVIFKITDKTIRKHLIKHTGISEEKKAPDYIGKLSPRQIKIFLDMFFMGDGHARRDCERVYYPGIAKILADQLQEYLLKIGKLSRIKLDIRQGRKVNYCVHEYKTPDTRTYLPVKDIKEIDYNDFAYCVTVPNRTLLVRRGGRPIFLGNTTCKELHDFGANLWLTTASDTNQGQVKRGFTTTRQTRPLILDRLEEDVRRHSAELRCPVLISQCKVFVHNEKNGKPEADGDFHDDGVISAAIAGYAIDVKPYKAKADVDYKRKQIAYDRRTKNKNAGAKF